jgi:hypothetical protein
MATRRLAFRSQIGVAARRLHSRVEFGVAGSARVENDAAVVRRPVRVRSHRSPEKRHPNGIGAVSVTYPNFRVARAWGFESNVFAVRGSLRIPLAAAGSDNPRGSTGRFGGAG